MAAGVRRVVPAFIRRSYALKFGLVLLILGISVGAIGFVATAAISDSVEQTALEDQEALAKQEATAVENWHERNSQLTQSIANTPGVQNDDGEQITQYLVDAYRGLPDQTENVFYVDTSTGDVIAGDGTRNVEHIDQINFPATAELDGDLSQRTVQQTEAYAMSSPATEGDEAVVSYYIGVGDDDRALIVTFNFGDRSGGMPTSGTSRTVVTILNADGQIIGDDNYLGTQYTYDASAEDSSFLADYGDAGGVLATAQAEGSGALALDEPPNEILHGDPYGFAPDGYVVGFDTTDDGWIVLVHTTDDQAFGFVNTVNEYGTYATLGGVFLIGIIGAILGRTTATSIDRLTSKAAEMEDGNLDVDFESKRIDNIGRLYDGFDSMRVELKTRIAEAEDARAEAESERERVQTINDDLRQAATEYGTVMEDAAAGDLTVRADVQVDNETMAQIGDDINEMLAEIEATVERVTQFATDVAAASQEVTASSEEVRSASEQVAGSIQEISDGADRQHESLQSVDAEMNVLSTTTEEIAASSNEVADIAARTARTGRDGRNAAQEAMAGVEQLETERETVVEEFERLRHEVAQIDELIESITEIAEQTNMLALNANIEASRSASNNASEGFGVVAGEVKELSQDAKEVAQEIGDRLESIQSQTERSAQEVDRASTEIDRVNDLVANAVDALDEIAEYAQETNDGVQEISAASEEQAGSTQEAVAMVDEVASISEETTAEAENVAAAAEEQTTAMTEVSRSAADLSKQATVLSETLDRFETDADVDVSVSDYDVDVDAPVGDGALEQDLLDADSSTDVDRNAPTWDRSAAEESAGITDDGTTRDDEHSSTDDGNTDSEAPTDDESADDETSPDDGEAPAEDGDDESADSANHFTFVDDV